MVEKPYERLDAMERSLRDDIKTVAEDFNDVNSKNKELRKWLSATKRIFNVISSSLNAGKINRTTFIRTVESKLNQAVARIDAIAGEYGVLTKEIDMIRQNIQSFQSNITDPTARRLIADIAVILTRAERNSGLVLEALSSIRNAIRTMGGNIVIAINDQTRLRDVISYGFNIFDTVLDEADLLAKRCMTDILVFHKIQYKIYQIQKHAR